MGLTSIEGFAILLALVAPAASPSTKWVVSGSGPDMAVTLGAQKTTPPPLVQGVPRLVLSCREQKAEVAIVLAPGRTPTTLRFDRETAIAARAHQRTKFGGLFSTQPKVVDPDTFYFDKTAEIVSSLLSHQSLLVRSISYGGPVKDSTFGLAGLEPHLAAFEQACGLKQPLPRPAIASGASGSKTVTPVTPPTPAALPVERVGEWKVSRPISPLDDQPIVLLSLAAPPTGSAPASSRATLVLRCRAGEAEAFLDFDWAIPRLSPNYLAVQASVDGGKHKEWWLYPSSGGRAYFFGSGPQLLKRLLASKEFRLSLGPKKRRGSDSWMPEGELVYSLAGLDRASRAFLEKCPVNLSQVKVKDGLGPLP